MFVVFHLSVLHHRGDVFSQQRLQFSIELFYLTIYQLIILLLIFYLLIHLLQTQLQPLNINTQPINSTIQKGLILLQGLNQLILFTTLKLHLLINPYSILKDISEPLLASFIEVLQTRLNQLNQLLLLLQICRVALFIQLFSQILTVQLEVIFQNILQLDYFNCKNLVYIINLLEVDGGMQLKSPSLFLQLLGVEHFFVGQQRHFYSLILNGGQTETDLIVMYVYES